MPINNSTFPKYPANHESREHFFVIAPEPENQTDPSDKSESIQLRSLLL